MARYRTLEFSEEFLTSFAGFSPSERKQFVKMLRLLDTDETHPSLRVHKLLGGPDLWSASASSQLRLLFIRVGRKKHLITCSHHYDK